MKHFYTKFILIAIFFAMIFTVPIYSQTNLEVVEDTYISSRTSPDETGIDYSAAEELRCRVSSTFEQMGFLKFDLSSITGAITSATLEIYCRRTDATTVSLEVYEYANDTWQDSETYDGFGGLVDSFGTVGNQIGDDIVVTNNSSNVTKYTLDVTAYVQAEYGGDQILTLALRRDTDNTSSGAASVRVFSKETLVASAVAPTLVIEESSLSTDDFSISEFSMYPNPAKDKLNIETNSIMQSASVFSILGKRVLHVENINNNSIELDLNRLTNGIYLVKIIDDNGSASIKKFVKQ